MRPDKVQRDNLDASANTRRHAAAPGAELTALDTQTLLAPFCDLFWQSGSDEVGNIEALQRATFVQLPLGIGYAARDGRLIWCNRAFDEMLGLAPGEHKKRSIRDLTFEADFQPNDQMLKDLWLGKIKSYVLEKRYVKRDGTMLWVRVTAALVRSPDGEPLCTVGFLENISSRKTAEAALQQSRRLIDAVAENVPVALIACDTSGAVTFSNRAADELFAANPTGADQPAHADAFRLGTTVLLPDGVTPLRPEDQPLARALRGENLANFEFVLTTADAAPRVLLGNACPLAGLEGEGLGAVAVLQDISQLRKAQEEVERAHRDLMDASRQAGMAEVATNVLHNVGNVLNSVNVSASLVTDLLKRSKATKLADVASLLDQNRDNLAQLFAQDERFRQLPRYLGALATQLQVERDAIAVEMTALRANLEHIREAVTMQQSYAKLCGVSEPVSVIELVESSLSMNSGALTRHHVVLKRDFRDAPTITVEKHKVLQILVNLFRNAKYACDESGNADKLVIASVLTVEDRVRIIVCDNGIGIAPETMGRMFSHGFTTRKAGHGFGLHSAALAAVELGGSLTVKSDGLGCGATFTLDLPFTPPELAHE